MRYVYLVRAGIDQYKIGVSGNIDKRIAALQTSNINLVELVCAKRTMDDSIFEKKLHKKVREFSGTGGKEWFHLNSEQAIEVAIEINRAPSADIAENIIQDLKKEVRKIIEIYENKIIEEREQLLREKKILAEVQISKLSLFKKTSERENKDVIRVHSDDSEYANAKDIVLNSNRASVSYLQSRMSIGFVKASRFMQRMEDDGIVGPLDGIRRDVL